MSHHAAPSVTAFKALGAVGALTLGLSAPAMATPSSCTYAQINSPGGCTLVSGDKTITKVAATNTVIGTGGVGFENDDLLTFGNDGTTWSLTWDFTPGQVATGPAVFGSGLQLSITDPTKILNTASLAVVGNGTVSTSISGGIPSLNSLSGPLSSSWPGSVDSATVSFTFAAFNGETISSATLNITQKDAAPVPGPLPILGGATAFGFSRRLRRRIKAVA